MKSFTGISSRGDAVAFHALTLHHAPGNPGTKSARKGYSLRFMGSEVRYKETPGMNRLVLNPDLRDGDSMDSEQYPVVFPRAGQPENRQVNTPRGSFRTTRQTVRMNAERTPIDLSDRAPRSGSNDAGTCSIRPAALRSRAAW